MLNNKDIYGLIVIDTSEAAIGILNGNYIECVSEFTSNVMRKHNQGGQSAQRFERLREVSINEFFKKVSDGANNYFLKDFEKYKGIIIGGISPTKENFIKSKHLHHEIRKKIIGVVNTSYTNENGLYELINNSEDIISNNKYKEYDTYMTIFLKNIAIESNKVLYGYDIIYDKIISGNIETILISSEFNIDKTKYILSIANKLNIKTIIIPNDFKNGDILFSVFGGIAALLHY